jgi:hypothetical protein
MQKVILVLFLFLSACGKKDAEEEKPGVLSLREMSDLATVEYVVTKVIKASDNKTWFKIGNRKILMSCEAHIKAGIDMSAINESSFKVTGKSIEVTLPQPKIISISLPAELIKVEYEEISAFRDEFTSEDRNNLASQAEQQIKKNIEAMGILNQAKVNTSAFVSTFLKRLGYENISIKYNGNQPENKMQ